MKTSDIYGVENENGDISVMCAHTNQPVTCMNDFDGAEFIHPVDSDLSVMHEHPDGIKFNLYTSFRIGLSIKESIQ